MSRSKAAESPRARRARLAREARTQELLRLAAWWKARLPKNVR